jgi:hypothetical protein
LPPADLLHVETILSINIEMGIPRLPDMREIGLVEGTAFLFELLYRRRHIRVAGIFV